MTHRLQPARRVGVFLIATLCGLLFAAQPGLAEAPRAERPTDYAVIANYLAVFCRYVTWPAADPDAPTPATLRIGVLGPNPFGTALDKVLAGKTLGGRPLVAVYATDIAHLADCQIVFINSTDTGEIADALATLAGKPVLTTIYHSDTADAPVTGAAIELVRVRNNVRYLLNPAALATQGLQPTPGLLENALRRIGGPKP
jgi:hypothetical protein